MRSSSAWGARVVVAAVSGALLAFGLGVGCGGSTATTPVREAGPPVDAAPRVDDAAPDAPDAASDGPTVDPCGAAGGLAPRAPWPMQGACAGRPAARRELRGPSSGATAVAVATPGRATSPVVADDGAVVVGTADGRVVAIAPDGKVRWDVAVGGAVEVAPALVAGAAGAEVLCATAAGALVRFALADGREIARAQGAPRPTSPLPLAGGGVAYTADDRKLHLTGADLVEAKVIDVRSVEAVTLAPRGELLVAGEDGVLRDVSADGAQVRELFRAGAPLVTPPVVSPFGDVVVGAKDAVLAIDPGGRARFRVPIEGAPRGPLAVGPDGSVYVATTAGKVVGIDRAGAELFAFAPLGLAAPPVVAGSGAILFGAEDTKLYALAPSGRLLFALALRARATSSAALGASGGLSLATEGGLVLVGP